MTPIDVEFSEMGECAVLELLARQMASQFDQICHVPLTSCVVSFHGTDGRLSRVDITLCMPDQCITALCPQPRYDGLDALCEAARDILGQINEINRLSKASMRLTPAQMLH